MKCPHCLIAFHEDWNDMSFGDDVDGSWKFQYLTCPSCKRFVCRLERYTAGVGVGGKPAPRWKYFLVKPKAIARNPVPEEVPDKYAQDYKEACLVLSDSAKASAALSRRCLQNILREVAGVKPSNLYDEIQEVLDSKSLPSYLSESLDAVRNIGNFAAHPIKSEKAAEIIEVEPGEAEWSLEVLEGLFDFYFVQPAKLKAKKDALNKKLEDAGKPKMK